MPDPSELIFPDDAVFAPPLPPRMPSRPPMRPPRRPSTPPLCSISGTVKNRFGIPVGESEVLLFSSPRDTRPIRETVTDRFGRFSFGRIPTGNYTVTAKSRYRTARQRVSLDSRNCNIRNINLVL